MLSKAERGALFAHGANQWSQRVSVVSAALRLCVERRHARQLHFSFRVNRSATDTTAALRADAETADGLLSGEASSHPVRHADLFELPRESLLLTDASRAVHKAN